jgi:hypothetical protein
LTFLHVTPVQALVDIFLRLRNIVFERNFRKHFTKILAKCYFTFWGSPASGSYIVLLRRTRERMGRVAGCSYNFLITCWNFPVQVYM